MTPGIIEIDMNQYVGGIGPMLMSFSYWCTVAAPSSGNLFMELKYEDPNNNIRHNFGNNVSLNNLGDFYSAPPFMFTRHDDDSMFLLRLESNLSAVNARYAFRCMFSSAEQVVGGGESSIIYITEFSTVDPPV